MLTAPALKALLKTHGLRLTKRLGQHHLIEPSMLARIAEACALGPNDTVVDIGAGLGALTEALAPQAGQVLAVEVDRGVARLLAERLASRSNVRVLQQDILALAWERLPDSVVVAGAIPYRLTSPILIALSAHRSRIRRAVLVVQAEVAQRLLAPPNTKAYGRLSVLVQYGWQPELLFPVPRRAFFPQPRVDSACVRLTSRPQPAVAVRDERLFFDVVRVAFAHRRKTLANCLQREPVGSRHIRDAAGLLAELGLPVQVRGEALSLEQFAALANRLAPHD